MTQSRTSRRARPRAFAATLALGLALLATAKVEAQYWFSYGYGGIYPAYTGIFPAYTGITPAYTGITPAYTGLPGYAGISPGFGVYNGIDYDPYAWYDAWTTADALSLASYGMAQASFNLADASSSTLADANGLLNQAAQQEMLWKRSLARNTTPSARYSVRSGSSSSTGRQSPQALVALTSRDGDVLWPITSPNQGDLFKKRGEASQAIKAVMRDFRSKGTAPVDEVVSALRALHTYVDPAVASLRKERPADLNAFLEFTEGLDSGLRGLTPAPPPPPAPDEAPKAEAPKP